MGKDVLVYIDLHGTPHLAGRLWARTRSNKDSASFEYDKSWLGHAGRFSLEPALKLGPGPFHTPSGKPLFGAIDLDDGTAHLELALAVGEYFELKTGQARDIAGEVGRAVARWRTVATGIGLTKSEIDRLASAFEHGDLKKTLSHQGYAR